MSRRSSLSVRLLNRVSRAATSFGIAPPITPAALRGQAERQTGLRHWHGPTDDPATFDAALERLCASVDASPPLNGLGRLALHMHLLRALRTRLLRVQADAVPAPALLHPVLVVVGLPRSGTTYLHRILAHAPGTRALRLWEVQQPCPPARGPDRRRDQAARQLEVLHRLSPELDHKHSTAVDAPEECFFLLDDSLVSPAFPLLFPLEPYRRWRHRAPVHAAYQAYRRHLCRLQAETPHQRLVLKAPGHAEHLAAIADAVPEAVFVHTHRSAEATVPSRASLVASFHQRFCDALDLHAVGRACLDDAVHLLRGSAAGRAALPPTRLFDVQYDDLLREPTRVAEAIHRWSGVPPDPHVSRAVAREARDRPVHRYSAADFGLTDAEIATACAPHLPVGRPSSLR